MGAIQPAQAALITMTAARTYTVRPVPTRPTGASDESEQPEARAARSELAERAWPAREKASHAEQAHEGNARFNLTLEDDGLYLRQEISVGERPEDNPAEQQPEMPERDTGETSALKEAGRKLQPEVEFRPDGTYEVRYLVFRIGDAAPDMPS